MAVGRRLSARKCSRSKMRPVVVHFMFLQLVLSVSGHPTTGSMQDSIETSTETIHVVSKEALKETRNEGPNPRKKRRLQVSEVSKVITDFFFKTKVETESRQSSSRKETSDNREEPESSLQKVETPGEIREDQGEGEGEPL